MDKELFDNDFITALQRGQEWALTQLVKQLRPRLCYFAAQFVEDKAVAEEIVADSFLKFWKIRQNFSSQQNIYAFFYVTTRNAAFDHLRKRKATQQQVLADWSEKEESIEEEGNVLNSIITAEVLGEIHRQIENLPARRREVFKLYYLEELSTDEIAARLHMTPSTVRTARQQALRQLKELLGQKNLLVSLVLQYWLCLINNN